MKTDVQVFKFKDLPVRVVLNEKNEPEFCASDVTKILGYANGRDAIAKHCKSRGVAKRDIPSVSGNQEYTFLDEGNLYRLVLKSEKPEAEPFETWVCDEVLPSIRKNGFYMTTDTAEKALADPDAFIKVLQGYKEMKAAKELAEATAQLQSEQLRKAAPKVDYFDTVLQAENTHTVTTIAKELGMSGKALNKGLKARGIAYYQDGHWVLYAKYQGLGYTKTRTHTYEVIEAGKNVKKTSISTVWTEKGREFLHKTFNLVVYADKTRK